MILDSIVPIYKVPQRTPKAVVEAVVDIIQGKKVCDIGCAAGDLLAFMSCYASSVVGVEFEGRRSKQAIVRGIEVVEGDAFLMPELPKADVYYFWDGEVINMRLLKKLLRDRNFHGTILYAVGDHTLYAESPSPVIPFISGPSDVRHIPYNEGSGIRESGMFIIVVVNADEARARMNCTAFEECDNDGLF